MSEHYGSRPHEFTMTTPDESDALFELDPILDHIPLEHTAEEPIITAANVSRDDEVPRDDAWNDLGNHGLVELSPDQESAVVHLNLGNAAMKHHVLRTEAHRVQTEKFGLTGVINHTESQQAAVMQEVARGHKAADAKAIENGEDPTYIAARRRARDRQH